MGVTNYLLTGMILQVRGGKLPSLKLTFSHLKMDGNGILSRFLLGWPIFRSELLVLGSVSKFTSEN